MLRNIGYLLNLAILISSIGCIIDYFLLSYSDNRILFALIVLAATSIINLINANLKK